jgi:ABC-type Na+ efflux pump permease subunit
MWQKIGSIARFTALEAVRGRLAWLLGGSLIAVVLLAEFAGAIAITESNAVKTALAAGVLRLFAVFVIALFVISSMAREQADKGSELILSLPLSRAVYYFGKLLGYGLVALAAAAVFALSACLFAPPAQALWWGVSLFCELLLVTAVSLLCLFTLKQLTTALSVVAAFYVLSRAIAAIQLIGHGPVLDPGAWSNRFMTMMIDGLAFVLPDLYRFTPSHWLVYHDGSAASLFPIVMQTLIYLCLLAAASLFDLYRKNF